MSISIRPVCPGTHPAIVTEVERRSLAGEIRQCLLSLSSRSKDRRIQNLRKDLYREHNKAPETIASLLTEAFNSKREDPETFTATIRGFFSARLKRLRRKLSDLIPLETREEGTMNNTEMRVAQGDLSRPTLVELKREIAAYRVILDEMDDAIDAELYLTEIRS